MRKGRMFRYLMTLVTLMVLFASASIVGAQEPATPIAVPTVAPTETVDVSPTLEPAAEASPTDTQVSGVVDNGDGSYTLTANAGDVTDLDLSALMPAGGISFAQLVALSATIVSVDGPCSSISPVFYLNDFSENSPTQGVLIAIGDPGNAFACSTGATGNLIENGSRFFTYHPDQSGGPSDGSYASMLNWLGDTNLPGMKVRLDNSEGSSTASITIGDISLLTAPTAILNVSVLLCQTSDADALAREVDYALDPFGPAAVPDCTSLDPSGIPISTSLLDANGNAFATFDAVAQSDGSISPTVDLGSATFMQFSEGLFGTTSDPLTIPAGGGANVGITIYVSGVPGSIALRNVNAVGLGGLGGATFALYRESCEGSPIATGTTDSGGNVLFSPLIDGTYCIANTVASPGFPLIDPVPNIVVASGQAVNLGNLESEPPLVPVTIRLSDQNASGAIVPGACVALYHSAGFPDGTPTGLLAPKTCDDDGDGKVVLPIALGIPFEVTILTMPLGYAWYAPIVGNTSSGDLPNGIELTQDVWSGVPNGAIAITAWFCTVSDSADAGTSITVETDTGTPTADPGCSPLDASFTLAPFGVESGYAPIHVTTVNGVASAALPQTGDAIDPGDPHTLHAIVDDQRPGASGVSATFDVPTDGESARQIVIVVSALEIPATPIGSATVAPEPTITPTHGVVALPNTGAGEDSSSGSLPMIAVLLAVFGALVMVTRQIAMRTR
ncbi:hypothetical protein BH09CHL1_BH09CHL1_02280 [soil metagenome]